MSSGLKARVARLHANSIGDVSSHIIITKQDTVLREAKHGTNANKVIRIVVRL